MSECEYSLLRCHLLPVNLDCRSDVYFTDLDPEAAETMKRTKHRRRSRERDAAKTSCFRHQSIPNFATI